VDDISNEIDVANEGDEYLQMLAAARDDADRTAVFYLGLIAKGIHEDKALHLTGEWLHAMTEEWEEDDG
jgi:hypothetical protein